MQDVADSETQEQYLLSLASLKLMPAYKDSPKVMAYFEKEWLDYKVHWAACDRLPYHAGANTNNHLESMNSVVKNKFLATQQDKRLDSLLKSCINDIIPYYTMQYRKNNYASIM